MSGRFPRIKILIVVGACLLVFQNCGKKSDLIGGANSPTDGQGCLAPTITILKNPGGGRLDWHPTGNSLVFDRVTYNDSVSNQPCYETYTMNADGSNEQCVTCSHPDMPTHNKGQPAWHPNGRHLMFQAEKQTHSPGVNCGIAANPGAGVYNDIWVLDTQTNSARALVTVGAGQDFGVLHPHFSPDGTKLLWSELYSRGNIFSPGLEAGKWKIMIADVSIDGAGVMTVSNATQLLPKVGGAEGFFETHGFTQDGTRIQYSSGAGYGIAMSVRSDIWTADLMGNNIVKLTDGFYNEHMFHSKSGAKAVFMSNRFNGTQADFMTTGTEFYMIDSNGSNICQLTHFNQSGFPESQSKKTTAADISWHPNGRKFAGYSHANGAPEIIWILDFGSVQ